MAVMRLWSFLASPLVSVLSAMLALHYLDMSDQVTQLQKDRDDALAMVIEAAKLSSRSLQHRGISYRCLATATQAENASFFENEARDFVGRVALMQHDEEKLFEDMSPEDLIQSDLSGTLSAATQHATQPC